MSWLRDASILIHIFCCLVFFQFLFTAQTILTVLVAAIIYGMLGHFLLLYHLLIGRLLFLGCFIIVVIVDVFKVVEISIVHVEIVFVVVACSSSKGCLTQVVRDRLISIILLCTSVLFFPILRPVLGLVRLFASFNASKFAHIGEDHILLREL